MTEQVEHPKHYNSLGAYCLTCGRDIEAIDVLECVPVSNISNAMKYLWRADDKGDPMTNLKKARWYIEREIDKRNRDKERSEQ